ncbi:duf636 domain protein [Colletotrichum karsti]|uniref:Duf636 domain protein n=1 Tax=Colletotrichum karsti TaxID=1095194 RepID=A0A9P6HYK9_9PEZI|nr:duf636 domain protein [Colletotrichum karsti]KAF9871496.1 duf636 domain protein [Colletotrichum karsti]
MPTTLDGRCVCSKLQYSVELDSPDDARTSLCHCSSCKRAFGTNYGLTTKVRRTSLLPLTEAKPTVAGATGGLLLHRGRAAQVQQDNGVIREFCGDCGAFTCEYGEAAADKFRYVVWGTFDEPDKVPPRGEFFCSQREGWMPQIEGVFHKQEIKQ